MSTKSLTADVIIIGGGAAGMMAASTAGSLGKKVVVLEPGKECGRKLRITGKGRCNVTNHCDCASFLKNVVSNPKFLKSALYRFTPEDTEAWFESHGVPLKVERGNRVFPVSDKSSDIVNALRSAMKETGVRVEKSRALEILTEDGAACGVKTDRGIMYAPSIILCTGGLSYPLTGSTGEGYALAQALGHSIVEPVASLVPLEAQPDCEELQGLSLRNVTLRAYKGDKLIFEELGELLFTHFGVSGPLVLSASVHMHEKADYRLSIDLKSGLSEEKLDERILRDFGENLNRCFKNSLDALLPQKMIPVIIRRSGIDPEMRVNSITRGQRLALVELLKHFELEVTSLRSVDEAIVTAGGVDVSEVNPKTMESRLVPGLFFAGEILDIDGYTGGFNLQIAWSTAVCAANHV